ncbi:hypothetical protein Golob_002310 [Gossypium lobatum]|uniref:SET domain-containing protein n=1 Tax=Gossypium lobatum TaxID=34289 RepID=A0A7J8N4P9_9ROSI|nr:hypothetical protein [Gossypium lobatum]
MTISRRVSNLISCSVLSVVFDHISPGQKGLDSGGHLSLVLPKHGLSLYLLYKILALEDSFHVNGLQRPAYLVSFINASLPCCFQVFFFLIPHCRSLFASENIRTGDCILKVPYSVEITPDNLLPKIRAILSDKIGTVSKLAIILLVERKMGQSSGWAPYICCLPQHGEIHSTIFWSEYELNMICQSSVYQETVNQKAKIEKDFAAVVPALQQFPDLESITLQDFMCAYFSGRPLFANFVVNVAVTSRAWESTKGLSLIPFTDFMNHDGVSKSIVLFDDDKMFSEVIADRNYAPGEEVRTTLVEWLPLSFL